MEKDLKKIGITGGIGSGKTTVCRIFESLGIAVFYADERAKYLMTHKEDVIIRIQELLGENAYHADGSLNRKWIGKQVFNNDELLEKLNAIVHPATRRDYDHWIESIEQRYRHSFILREAAILYESGAAEGSDGVITVYAPKKTRIERVMKRDGVSQEDVMNRMHKQWPDAEKIRRSDLTIFNDGFHLVIPQVLKAIKMIENKSIPVPRY